MYSVEAAQIEAMRSYEPRVYTGPITLFRAKEIHPAALYEETLFWGDLLPNLVVRDVPGNHHTIYKEPYVKSLATEIAACLISTSFP